MKSDLMEIFGAQIRWFAGLNMKQRFYVLYFLFSFSLLLLVNCDSLATDIHFSAESGSLCM